MPERTAVGFIGLGLMGKPMAYNLLKAGFALTVHDRRRDPVDVLVGDGARPAGSPAEVAAACEFVVSCLPGPAEVKEVYLGPAGVVAAARPCAVLVEMSTIDPNSHRQIAAAAAARGVYYLDAPVTGGTVGAAKGTLTVMVGGEAAALERARPLLTALGERIYHLGPVGSGATAKLVNNMLGAINTLAMAEAVVLAVKAGLDPQLLLEVTSNGTGASRQLTNCLPNILKRNFQPGFTVDLMRKDVNLALEMGRSLGVRLLAGALAAQVFQEAQNAGLGGLSHFAIIRTLEQNAGVEVKERQ